MQRTGESQFLTGSVLLRLSLKEKAHEPPFAAAFPMNDSRFKLPDEAVRLATGKLLVAGGSKQVEVFDPSNRKFTVAAGQLSEP